MLDFREYLKALDKKDRVTTEKDAYCVRVRNSRKDVNIPKKASADLCYFIGYFLGDGGLKNTKKTWDRVGKKEYKLVVGDYSKRFALRLRDLFCSLFEYTPPLRCERASKGEHYFYINPTSKAIHLFLTKVVQLGEGKHFKTVPKTMLTASKSMQQWFLRGYFDAEGSVYRKYNRKTWVISVHAKEHRLLRQVQKMLGTAFGIRLGRLYREKNASKLFITSKKEVQTLFEKGLFTHPDKISKYAAVAQPVRCFVRNREA